MQSHHGQNQKSGSIKYIFVTGGVVSGLGKGITAASLGRLLKERGYKVTIQKFDPYINVNPGTMSPYQHGEVFVTYDGAETDLDVGHYERFIDENLSLNSDITSGKIYWDVINRERSGDYMGATVQVIPHITNEIKSKLPAVATESGSDIVITEIGGTVGDIEGLPFLEAIRQFAIEVGRDNAMFIHVTLVPYVTGSEELKTKPTQHSVKELRSLGISPSLVVCRSELPLNDEIKHKISLFCDVRPQDVIQNLSAPTLYEVPLMLEKEGLADRVCEFLGLEDRVPDLADWTSLVSRIKNVENVINIALVGKYVELLDAYLSASEALRHAGFETNCQINIKWISSEDINEENVEKYLADCHGIFVPSGFGERGIDGKIVAINYARTKNIPFFGVSLGMQLMAVEFARNVLNLSDSHSAEFGPNCTHPVVKLMNGQMRLGQDDCILKSGSRVQKLYESDKVSERHRHKYKFNIEYKDKFDAAGMKIVATSQNSGIVEAIELEDHPFFIGVQYHPEFKSRPNRAHPLFKGFIKACLDNKN